MGQELVIGWIGIALALLGWAFQLGSASRETKHLKERQTEMMETAKERYERICDKLEKLSVECPECPGVRLDRR